MDFSQSYQKKSLSEVAVTYIKNMVLSGAYKSGDKIIESEISAELDISRAPVREALRQLNVEGMISFSPRRGNFVVDLSLDEVLEIFEIRLTLEKQIYQKLIRQQMLTKEDFDKLYQNIDQMDAQRHENLQENDMLFWLNSLDIQFHSYLWQVSKSEQRGKILEGLFYMLLLLMNRDIVTLGTFHEKALEHKRIVDALRKNDLDDALAQLDAHINVYINALTDML